VGESVVAGIKLKTPQPRAGAFLFWGPVAALCIQVARTFRSAVLMFVAAVSSPPAGLAQRPISGLCVSRRDWFGASGAAFHKGSNLRNPFVLGVGGLT
jgi:hypothetical protein